MKKIIGLAVLVAINAAPVMADTKGPTIYGNFRGSLNTGDLNGIDNDFKFENNASRLGVKGSSDLGGSKGITGIYNLQMAVDNDSSGDVLSSRFYFVGLEGGFGKVIVGRLSTPYKMDGVKQDPFYDTSAGTANAGSNYGYSALNNGFTNNTIAYYSPKIGGGLTVNTTLSIDDSENDGHDFGIGAEYAKKNIKVGVSHLVVDANDAEDASVIAGSGDVDSATRIFGSFSTEKFAINASFEKLDVGSSDDISFVHLNGTYALTEKTKLAASFGTVSDGVLSGRHGSGDGFSIGIFHKILEKVSLSVLYSNVDYDAEDEVDRDGLALGVVFKF